MRKWTKPGAAYTLFSSDAHNAPECMYICICIHICTYYTVCVIQNTRDIYYIFAMQKIKVEMQSKIKMRRPKSRSFNYIFPRIRIERKANSSSRTRRSDWSPFQFSDVCVNPNIFIWKCRLSSRALNESVISMLRWYNNII